MPDPDLGEPDDSPDGTAGDGTEPPRPKKLKLLERAENCGPA